MTVSVMQVGIVRVRVADRRVSMAMRVRLTVRRSRFVLVPVMPIMRVEMLVSQRLVGVIMDVALADMEPHAKPHEDAGHGQA